MALFQHFWLQTCDPMSRCFAVNGHDGGQATPTTSWLSFSRHSHAACALAASHGPRSAQLCISKSLEGRENVLFLLAFPRRVYELSLAGLSNEVTLGLDAGSKCLDSKRRTHEDEEALTNVMTEPSAVENERSQERLLSSVRTLRCNFAMGFMFRKRMAIALFRLSSGLFEARSSS